MIVEILGGALLANALIKPRSKGKIEKQTQSGQVERYAVIYEVKQGKGAGTFGVSHLCSDRNEASTWAKNACMALCATSPKFDEWATNSAAEDNILELYECWGESDKVIYGVIVY